MNLLGFTSCQIKILHLSHWGCDWLLAVVGERGEVMSLVLLMTFSTCDPFNKSVHIKPCVLITNFDIGLDIWKTWVHLTVFRARLQRITLEHVDKMFRQMRSKSNFLSWMRNIIYGLLSSIGTSAHLWVVAPPCVMIWASDPEWLFTVNGATYPELWNGEGPDAGSWSCFMRRNRVKTKKKLKKLKKI